MSFVTPKIIVTHETIALLFSSDNVEIRRFAAALNNALQEKGKIEVHHKDLIDAKSNKKILASNNKILAQLRKH